jgi:DNA-binding CsgD family transcriptional regulator
MTILDNKTLPRPHAAIAPDDRVHTSSGYGVSAVAGRTPPGPKRAGGDTKRKSGLSAREGEVLYLLAMGKSGPEIAIILGISICTVRLHIQSIKKKLGASNIPHAVARGYALGVLGSSDEHAEPDP